jgi:hypothetical protein
LKKRTKKLLTVWLPREARPERTKESKSFLVLFFKKELLPDFASFRRRIYNLYSFTTHQAKTVTQNTPPPSLPTLFCTCEGRYPSPDCHTRPEGRILP